MSSIAVSIVLAIVGAAVTLTLAPWCSVFHQLHREVDDRHVDAADDGDQRAGPVGAARVVDRGDDGEEAGVEEEQDQLRRQARVPDPPGAPGRLAPERAGPEGEQGEHRAGRRDRARHHRRQPRVEGPADRGPERHHEVEQHRHPRRRHVDEDDPVGLALGGIGRRAEEADVEPGRGQRGGRGPAPGTSQPASRRSGPGRRTGRSGSGAYARQLRRTSATPIVPRSASMPLSVGHSVAMRRAAAVASGASSAVKMSSAPSSDRWPRMLDARLDRRDGAGAEDQRRNAERHDQQDQQHGAAAQAERQRRAQAAEQAQDRRAEQQRDARARRSPAAQAEHQAEQRRGDHQRHAGERASATPPSRAAMRRRDGAGEQHLLERAVGQVAGVELVTDSIAASSAATQTTPGAIRRSVCGSGPTPSGNRLIATVKKAIGSRASLRRRRPGAGRGASDDGEGAAHARPHAAAARHAGATSCAASGRGSVSDSGRWLVRTTLPPRRGVRRRAAHRASSRRRRRARRTARRAARRPARRQRPGAPARPGGAGPATACAPAHGGASARPKRSSAASSAGCVGVVAGEQEQEAHDSAAVRSSFRALAWAR